MGAAPVVLVALLNGEPTLAMGCTGWAIASDVLDGVFARRTRGPSRAGALLDAWSDLAFLISAFGALVLLGVVPGVLLALMLAAFLPFAAGAIGGRSPPYDPVGKHLGTMLYLLLLLALGVQDSALLGAGTVAAMLVLGAVVLQRLARFGSRAGRRHGAHSQASSAEPRSRSRRGPRRDSRLR